MSTVNISPAAANASTNLTQVGGVSIALGQSVSAVSLPVVIASDQSAIPCTLNAGSAVIGHVVVDSGTITAITNPVAVTGTFWQSTQPVSGTFWQTTQPVSGTFFQTTQPVSVASLPNEPNLDIAMSALAGIISRSVELKKLQVQIQANQSGQFIPQPETLPFLGF